MKTLLALILCIGVLLPGTGCSSLNGPPDPKWGTIAKVVTRRGTYEAVKAHPEYRVAFELTVAALDNLILREQVDTQDLLAALQKLPVDELRTDDGALLVQDALDLYDALVGDTLRLKDDTQLRAIVIAIRDGLSGGLAMVPDGTSG